MGSALIHSYRWTDRYDKSNRRDYVGAPKIEGYYPLPKARSSSNKSLKFLEVLDLRRNFYFYSYLITEGRSALKGDAV
jgi:hypothetical protein